MVRHAPTIWNELGLCQGWLSGELVEDYQLVVETIASKLLSSGRMIKTLISSDTSRAKETAESLFARLKCEELIFSPLLREINFGVFEGKHPKVIEERQPNIYDQENLFRHEVKLLGGESLNCQRRRTEAFINWLLATKLCFSEICLVCHEGTIRMMRSVVTGTPFNTLYRSHSIHHCDLHPIRPLEFTF